MEVFLVLAIAVAIIVVVIAIVRGTAPKDYVDASGRLRCGKCKKIVYLNGSSAKDAADKAERRGLYLRAYHEGRCGNWHLTSQLPRSRHF